MKNKVQVAPPAIRRSLNEVEAMGKRAARGVGLSWGLAEEAGKVVRWLTARGYPGVSLLADSLTLSDKRNYAELVPVDVDGVWRASSGGLCPLITGAVLCDRAAEIADGRVIELGETAQPLLLVPFVAGAVKLTGAAMAIGWDDMTMIVTPDREIIDGNPVALTARSTDHIRCRPVDDVGDIATPAAPVDEPAAPVNGPAAPVDDDGWSRLDVFAQRTFAPATEASRLSGAGAGLSDDN